MKIIIKFTTVFLLICNISIAQNNTWFTDVTVQTSLTGKYGFRIYAADVNGDDYPDLLVQNYKANSRNQLSLYINEQKAGSSNPLDRVFVDITAASGINAHDDTVNYSGRQTNLVALADVDNDGDVDLVTGIYYHRLENTTDYVSDARCEVLLNNGTGKFTIKPNNGLHQLGLINASGFSFLDYDKDGKIDLYIGTWFKDFTNYIYDKDFLMKGNGDGTFTDVTAVAGIDTIKWANYGTNVVDWNDDGWSDIIACPYCDNDGNLLQNNGNGTFTDVSQSAGYNARYMPVDPGWVLCNWASNPADFDNDGDIDLYLSLVHGSNDPSKGRSAIFVNEGPSNNYHLTPDRDRITWDNPQTSHRRDHYGNWFDMDHDGWMDLATTQCAYDDYQDKLFLIRQNPVDNTFDDITAELGYTGSGRIASPHALVLFDYDLDGDDDVLVGMYRNSQQLKLMRNEEANNQNFVAVKLIATSGINRSCIGAKIIVASDTLIMTREIYAGQGNFSSMQPFILNFGLGSRTSIDSIIVKWPDINTPNTVVKNPAINTFHSISPNGLDVKEKTSPYNKRKIVLHPNPSNGLFNLEIETTTNESIKLDIFNISGQLIYSKQFNNITHEQIDLSNYSKGIYFVKVQSEDVMKVEKLIVQ